MSTRMMRAKFVLDLTGNVRDQGRRFGRTFDRMSRDGERSFTRIGRAADRMNQRLNRTAVRGAQVGAVAAVAATAVAVRRLGTLEERLERLGIEAGKTSAQMNDLRNAVNDVSKDAKIRIDPGELLGAFEQIQEKTGDLDFGMAIKREMAIAIQATGQAGPVIGDLIASMYNNMNVRSPEEVRKALDTLTLQGRQGQFTIPNLAALGPRIFAAYGAFDRGGTQGIGEIGALAQLVRQGTGGPEQATSAIEAILRTFLDAEKIKKINTVGRSHGFSALDSDGKVRAPLALLQDLIRSARGDPVKLSKLFDSEAMRGVLPIAQEFRATGAFGRLDSLSGMRVSGGELASDAERLAGTLNASARGALTNINDQVEDALLGPLTELTKSLNALLDRGIELTADDALNIALAAAGVGLGVKGSLWALGRGGRRAVPGKAGRATSGIGQMAGAAAGVVPVFVTNLAGSGLGGGEVDRRGKARPGARTTGGSHRGISGGAVIRGGARALPALGWAMLGADVVGSMMPDQGSPSAMGVLSGGAAGLNTNDLNRLMALQNELTREGATDTTDLLREAVAQMRQMNVAIRSLQQRDRVAIGPAPETGRILEGPQ